MAVKRQAVVKLEPQERWLKAAAPGRTTSWSEQHAEQLAIADQLLGTTLGNSKWWGNFTNATLVDEIFNNILMSSLKSKARGNQQLQQIPEAIEVDDSNSSVLLLGESGSGKTHAVEFCVQRLREANGLDSTMVLRASGGAYTTDVECVRHLAAQVRGKNNDRPDLDVPPRHASFERGMEWIRGVLREGFRNTSAVVIILEKFEYFCSKERQTLLYNLFDIAQESGVRLSIIGTSAKMDVMDSLEKRIKSRFSMRHLIVSKPTRIDDLINILLEKLKLPEDPRLKAPFVKAFNGNLHAALRARSSEWAGHLDAGKPPAWFLCKCLPLTRFLREVDGEIVDLESAPTAKRFCEGLSPVKRRKTDSGVAATLPLFDFHGSHTTNQVDLCTVAGLCQNQHVCLIALHRLQARGVTPTLALVLHEVSMFYQLNRKSMAEQFHKDSYEKAFSKLVQANLIEVRKQPSADMPRLYLPCHSRINRWYGRFIDDVGEKVGSALEWNPLKNLPQVLQQWAMEMMRKAPPQRR